MKATQEHLGTMKLDTLQKLYLTELRELYHVEQQVLKTLPRLAKAASSELLREGLERHAQQTEHHVARLEEVFAYAEEKPRGIVRHGIKGLIEDALDTLQEEGEGSVLDASIAAAAQKIEHYEMASYGTLVAFADMLGYDNAAALLQETFDEESEATELLSSLTEEVVMPEVLMETDLGRSWSRSLSELLC